MIKPLVSIIIATYNEEKNIKTLLESCSDQNYKDLEILVVDSTRTTDKTSHIAKNFGVKVYKFGAERSVQRNYGVSKANGEYVLILDADMQLGKNVIKECIDKMDDVNFGGLVVPEKSIKAGLLPSAT